MLQWLCPEQDTFGEANTLPASCPQHMPRSKIKSDETIFELNMVNKQITAAVAVTDNHRMCT